MPAKRPNPVTRSRQHLHGQNMIRLRDPNTGRFLHLSGNGSTEKTALSWLGFSFQAQELLRRARIRGEAFPFQPVPRWIGDRLELPDNV